MKKTGKIIVFSFLSILFSFNQIFSQVAGKNLIQLTNSDSYNGRPVWSSDGSKIAFISNRGNSYDGTWTGFEIWIKLVGGGDPVKLKNTKTSIHKVNWSPDGKNMV
ncbi:TolB family protein, partial [candidate division KSB1 bacterium]